MQKKIIQRPAIEKKRTGLSAFSPHPVLHQIYAVRGLELLDELTHDLKQLLPYEPLLGIDQAVQYLVDALIQQKKILIVGDFDVDGATSTVVALRALRAFGAKHTDFLVPNRFAFGYGLTPELVAVAHEQFQPDLIITVDNGIANHEGVAAAKALNIQVIITDHHLAGDTLPIADAIVNPNQPNDPFASKNLAGVGVIFYVMLALRRRLLEQNWFSEEHVPEPNMANLLDLVALGTVADVVPLDHNNRILVQQGLRRMRAKRCAVGIIALLEIANKNPARVVASDLGFAVAPRLNAAGRLEDMSLGIACLLSDNPIEAREIAMQLDQLNHERREIEHDMQLQALHFLNALKLDEENLPRGICLFHPEWHQGVIGILASRMKDRFRRPVIACAVGNQGDELKASARSIAGVHIRDVLAQIDAQHPKLMTKFGGHAMAAGLTLPRDNFDHFRVIFNQTISEKISEHDLAHIIYSDGELSESDLNLGFAELLREAGPWGQGFPEPLFHGIFYIMEQRLLAEKHLKFMLAKGDNINIKGDNIVEAIAFNIDLRQWPNHRCQFIHIAYRLDVNEYRNKRRVQLVIEHLEPGENARG